MSTTLLKECWDAILGRDAEEPINYTVEPYAAPPESQGDGGSMKAPVIPGEPTTEPEEIAPYGETFGRLTRFGDLWIPLADARVVDFNPTDGCGAEVTLEGISGPVHFGDDEAAALKQYMLTHAITAAESMLT